jgi:hypothetical protein
MYSYLSWQGRISLVRLHDPHGVGGPLVGGPHGVGNQLAGDPHNIGGCQLLGPGCEGGVHYWDGQNPPPGGPHGAGHVGGGGRAWEVIEGIVELCNQTNSLIVSIINLIRIKIRYV